MLLLFLCLFVVLTVLCVHFLQVLSRFERRTKRAVNPLDYLRERAKKFASRLDETELAYQSPSGFYVKVVRRLTNLVKRAGYPLGWQPSDWLLLIGFGTVGSIGFTLGQIVYSAIAWGQLEIPLFTTTLALAATVGLPIWYLLYQAEKRSTHLFYDVLRSLNRLLEFLDFEMPRYQMLTLSVAGTRLLKQYLPSLDKWNADERTALEEMERQIGTHEGVIFTRSVRYCLEEQSVSAKQYLLRLETSLRIMKSEKERQKMKRLEIQFMLFVFPPFIMAVLAIAFPWYQNIQQILRQFL
ncbi:hypothetical protein [Brevibacillus dissolubilis]|uniref:hypothetical protein n=1 Tax=Brevibacillus dissolubilis TaxID=1844116 RepID=UPI0011166B5E|nr:hypothetical protein [Brevibacillus dissolubilis]